LVYVIVANAITRSAFDIRGDERFLVIALVAAGLWAGIEAIGLVANTVRRRRAERTHRHEIS
jgi:hypothetical protein